MHNVQIWSESNVYRKSPTKSKWTLGSHLFIQNFLLSISVSGTDYMQSQKDYLQLWHWSSHHWNECQHGPCTVLWDHCWWDSQIQSTLVEYENHLQKRSGFCLPSRKCNAYTSVHLCKVKKKIKKTTMKWEVLSAIWHLWKM